jgi:hypothetical protein
MVAVLVLGTGDLTWASKTLEDGTSAVSTRWQTSFQTGDFVVQGHKLWEWTYDEEEDIVLRQREGDGGFKMYEKDAELTEISRSIKYSPKDTVYSQHFLPP